MTRARALYVAAMPPATGGNGLAMRGGLFLEALSAVAQTELLLLPVFGSVPRSSPLIERLGVPVHIVPVDGRSDTHLQLIHRIADPIERLRQFTGYGRGSRHGAISAAVLADLRHDYAGIQYDLVHCQRLYLAPATAGLKTLRLTVDLDEDDAVQWTSGPVTSSFDRDWAAAEAAAEDRLLADLRARAEIFFVSSSRDLGSLIARHVGLAADVVENGVHFPKTPERADDGRTLLFVGAYGYRPNAEGAAWFIKEVLPRLADLGLKLVLVGPDTPEWLAELAKRPDIEMRGRVESLDAIYAAATIAIGPLLSGGGTRTKLIEAAAYAVPIVATTRAASGLDFLEERAWLTDGAENFGTALRAALAAPEERRRRAEAARAAAQLRHDRDRIISALAERFAKVLASPRQKQVDNLGHH